MRVVLVSDYYAPWVGGGVERVVEELATNLVDFGHEVRVLTLNPDGWPARETIRGVEVVRVPSFSLQRILGIPSAIHTGLGLRRYLEDADVIHVHNIFFLLSLLSVLNRPRAPVVTTLHLGALDSLNGMIGLAGQFYERTLGTHILKRSAAVTAVSPCVAEHAEELGAEGEVRVIPNTVDVQRFRPPEPDGPSLDRSVLFLGRLSLNKGPQYLVEAIPRVLAEVPDATFEFVGEGPLRPVLARRMAELKLNGHARISGKVGDVVPLLQRSGLVARPSLTEGMPLAVMEAMACGRPILASRVAGTGEIISHGETGLLFDPGDVDGLTEGLVRVLDDRAMAASMGRRARAWAERQMTWESVSKQYERLYEEVAS